jgi:hypothetical protein
MDVINERVQASRQLAKGARETLEQAERVKSFWEVLRGHLSRAELGSVLIHLEQNRDLVRSLREQGDPMSATIDSLTEDARGKVTDSVRVLGRSFPEAARNAGLVIDPSSRHPRYTFQDGYVRLELDEKRLTARLSTREGEDRQYGLDLDLIVRVLKKEISGLFDRELKPEPFLKSLRTAYSAALRAEGLPEGTEVPIRRVLHRLAKNLNRFSADEFNVDLARAVQSGQTSIDDYKLHLNHTRNTRQGMLLHGLEQGGYVGFISFKREEAR